ncbi:5968_t:CDS:2, partial [Acaulospora morrowiae]
NMDNIDGVNNDLWNQLTIAQSLAILEELKAESRLDSRERLYKCLIECLGTTNSVRNFLIWFFNGVLAEYSGSGQLPRTLSAVCFQCGQPYTTGKWCKPCEDYLFFENSDSWTSGSEKINSLILDSQINASDEHAFLRWIPYDCFMDVTKISEGGSSIIYTAKMNKDPLDGTLQQWVENMEFMTILAYLNRDEEELSQNEWDEIWEKFFSEYESRINENECMKEGEEAAMALFVELESRNKKGNVEMDQVSEVGTDVEMDQVPEVGTDVETDQVSEVGTDVEMNQISKVGTDVVTGTTTESFQLAYIPPQTMYKKFKSKLVVLKRLSDSSHLSEEIFDRLKITENNSKIIHCYGVTRDPKTSEYILVFEYANGGSLRKYLAHNFTSIDWLQRRNIVTDIISGLEYIHQQGLTHGNFHTGNILINKPNINEFRAKNIHSDKLDVWITDIGNYYPTEYDNESNSVCGTMDGGKTVYGLLPYIAPEVLCGQPRTQASDVYSLGIVVWEIVIGKIPYAEHPYNEELAREICKGLRPKLEGVSDRYTKLMESCWNAVPNQRPSVEEILKTLSLWRWPRNVNFNEAKNLNDYLMKKRNLLNFFNGGYRQIGHEKNENSSDVEESYETGAGGLNDARLNILNVSDKKLSSKFFYFERLPKPRNYRDDYDVNMNNGWNDVYASVSTYEKGKSCEITTAFSVKNIDKEKEFDVVSLDGSVSLTSDDFCVIGVDGESSTGVVSLSESESVELDSSELSSEDEHEDEQDTSVEDGASADDDESDDVMLIRDECKATQSSNSTNNMIREEAVEKEFHNDKNQVYWRSNIMIQGAAKAKSGKSNPLPMENQTPDSEAVGEVKSSSVGSDDDFDIIDNLDGCFITSLPYSCI